LGKAGNRRVPLNDARLSPPANTDRIASRSTTAKSLVWSTLENGGLAMISFVSLIIYSRLLSAAEFGLFATALAFVELLAVVVTMLFHNALVQRPEVTELHFNTAFTATMALSFALALACYAVAPLFAQWVHQPGAARVLIWMALVLPCSGLSATLAARQRRHFAFKSLALRSLVGRVIGGGIGIAAAFMGAGLWSLVAQQILIAGIGSLVLWVTSDKTPRLQFSFTEFKHLFGFGVLSVSGLFLSTSLRRVFTILASSALGVEAAGYLNLSFRVVDVFWNIAATAVSQVALPLLAGLQFEAARMKRAYQASTQLSCLALYPCFVGLGVVAPEVVEVLFGQRWLPSSPYVAVLGFLVLLQAPRLLFTPFLTALGKPRDSLVGLIAEWIFILCVTWIVGMRSLPWAIAVWVGGECVMVVVSSWMLRRVTGYTLVDQFNGILKPLLAVLLMAAALTETRLQLLSGLSPILRLIVLIPLGAGIYGGAIFLLDRRLVKDFLAFAQSAFARKLQRAVPP
jgi:O-antigen/teichoic acid export membrane protein